MLCVSSADSEGLASLVLFILSSAYIIYITSSAGSPEERDLMQTSCLGLSVSKSLFLHNVWLWISVFVQTASGGIFSVDG